MNWNWKKMISIVLVVTVCTTGSAIAQAVECDVPQYTFSDENIEIVDPALFYDLFTQENDINAIQDDTLDASYKYTFAPWEDNADKSDVSVDFVVVVNGVPAYGSATGVVDAYLYSFPNHTSRMKKSAIIIVWGVILCTSVFIVVHMLYYTKVQIETPTLIHKSFEGTISFYCDESDSPYTHIVIALANRPDKTERFVVTEDTIFADDSESIIAERIVGVHVEIESEYWNNVEYDYYPVTLISGCL